MVVEPVNKLVETKMFQILLAVLVISLGISGVLTPGNWALTQLPVLGGFTEILPGIIHRVLGFLITVAGLTDLNLRLEIY